MRHIDLIVIHCSATPSGRPLSGLGRDGRPLVAAGVIDQWHAQRGFRRLSPAVERFSSSLPHIGYHMVIDLDGLTQYGRALDEIPAQAAGFNARSIGICLVGGAEPVARYTLEQWSTLRVQVQALCETLSIPLARPTRAPASKLYWPAGYSVMGGVCGHRDLSPDRNGNGLLERYEWVKTCPGFDVGTWLDRDLQPLPEHVIGGVA